MEENKEFPEILEDSDNMNLPTISTKEVVEVTIEDPNKLVDGYNKEEGGIINNVRNIRNDLIKKLTATGVPRGKELEMTVSLLNDQESSAHKTAGTRLRVKSEETKEVVASSIMNFLFDERNKGRDLSGATEAVDPLSIKLPEEFLPEDIVDGEMSDIVKNNDLNVDDFMPIERDV